MIVGKTVAAVIPARDEEKALPLVLADLARGGIIDRVVVVDNASSDGTAEAARTGGAQVVREQTLGYGSACSAGVEALASDPPDIVLFLDGDYSDHPDEAWRVLAPVALGRAELVIGSRTIGRRDKGALPPQALFGNRLACWLMRAFYGARFTDLGPFRAISYHSLLRLDLQDRGMGWTVEMQVRACRLGLAATERPVSYRRRIGHSKITGTLKGSVAAGAKIIYTILHHALNRPEPAP